MSKNITTNRLKTDCTEPALNRLLNRFQDCELDDVSRRRVSAHLPECRCCREQLLELDAVTSKVKQMIDLEVEPGFNARLMGQVNQAKEASRWALPSVLYSLVFILFLYLGLYINGFMINDIADTTPAIATPHPVSGLTINPVDNNAGQDYLIAGMLEENRSLSLIDVQDRTIQLFDNLQEDGSNGQ